MTEGFSELVSFKGGIRLSEIKLDKQVEDYIKLGERLKLEGHPVRAILLDLLTKYPDMFYVTEITLIMENNFPGISYQTVTYHLRKMYHAGLLTKETYNGCLYYNIRTSEVEGITTGYTPVSQTVFRSHDLKRA